MRDKLESMFLVGFGIGCSLYMLLHMMATEPVIGWKDGVVMCVLSLCMTALAAIGLAIHREG